MMWENKKKDFFENRICNCIGPQDGQPRCPCMMKNVSIKDGRYVQITDLGPAKNITNDEKEFFAKFGKLIKGEK